MLERLQKILSARGIASRRKAEEFIGRGLVKVNGIVAKIGDKADPDIDMIEVDGAVIEARKELKYYVFYKPRGVVTTNAAMSGERTLNDALPPGLKGAVFPVGRLDKDSEGLLLLTNDGVLAYRLTHPKFDHEKEYVVETEEDIKEGQLQKMRDGMKILGAKTKEADVEKIGTKKFRIALTEGKNRQIRRMCQKVGLTVSRLIRTRIMTLKDPSLKPSQIRPLTEAESGGLLEAAGISMIDA